MFTVVLYSNKEAQYKWLNIDIHFNKSTPLNVNSV